MTVCLLLSCYFIFAVRTTVSLFPSPNSSSTLLFAAPFLTLCFERNLLVDSTVVVAGNAASQLGYSSSFPCLFTGRR